jgi:hypothetical protein
MAYGNVAAVKNLLEGAVATALANTGTTNLARTTQGTAILPSLIHQVAMRPDFSNLYNLKIYLGYAANTTATINIETVATQGVIALAWDNLSAVDGYLVIYGQATGVIGTTQQAITLYTKASTSGAALFPEPVVPVTNTGLSWNWTTNVTPGTTAGTASQLSLVVVYAK